MLCTLLIASNDRRDCIISYKCLMLMLTDVEVENENEESSVEHSSLSLSR